MIFLVLMIMMTCLIPAKDSRGKNLDNKTKGKIIDGTIVVVKTIGSLLLTGASAHSGARIGALPLPHRMWQNQRAHRQWKENLRKCIANDSFQYRGYDVVHVAQKLEYGRFEATYMGG